MFELRTLSKLENGDYTQLSKEFGINHRSSLLSLKYVDICSGILVPDVMHDVLEGVLQYEMKLLQHLIFEKSYFRVKTLEKLVETNIFSSNRSLHYKCKCSIQHYSHKKTHTV